MHSHSARFGAGLRLKSTCPRLRASETMRTRILCPSLWVLGFLISLQGGSLTVVGAPTPSPLLALQTYLKAGNIGAGDQFGYSVAVSGDTAVIGAPREDSGTTEVNSSPSETAPDAGAAYVFVRNGSTWNQQAYLKAGNAGANDNFGWSVAVSGNTVVVGASGEDSDAIGVNGQATNDRANSAGAAYVFVRSGTNWTQQAYLKASNAGVGDNFGRSVAVSGGTVVVGAIYESSRSTIVNGTGIDNSAFGSGAAYVFVQSGTNWMQQAYLKAGNAGLLDQFGYSVAVSDDTVVVGAYLEDSAATGVNNTPNENAPDAGAAYVFVRSGTNWAQQAYLKAGNAGAGDQFGISVAIDGDTAIVGASQEDGGATGANGTPDNNSGNSGAAYVFLRNGSNWIQQAYLKAGNTGAGDQFGISVAIAGNTVAVGAFLEDGSQSGVNSAPDENANRAGAAYVFARIGSTWTQQAYLKAGNNGAGDEFGFAVTVADDAVVVGAYLEDSSKTGVSGNPDEGATDAGAAYVFASSRVVEVSALGGLPRISLESLTSNNPGRMVTNAVALDIDTNFVNRVIYDSTNHVISVVTIAGQDGSTNRTSLTLRVSFSDGTSQTIVVPVIIYQPLLTRVSANESPAYSGTLNTPLFNLQTGLFEQKVSVSNNTPFAFTALRITATNLPATVTLQNVTITNGGLPYIDYNLTVPAGGGVTLKLEYFSSNMANFTPGLRLELLNEVRTNRVPTNAVMAALSPFSGFSPDGAKNNYLQFPTVAGRIYYIQYQDAMGAVWETSPVQINGTGFVMTWLDEGPPNTATPPGAARFYRIVTEQ